MSVAPPLAWSEPLTMHSYDVDFARRATVEALCRYFLEAAWNHAEALGFGFSHLARAEKVWVLSRLVLELEAYPSWGEQLRLETWPRGIESVFALRDFELLQPDGTRLAGGSSAWLILDARSRRPQRIEKFLAPITPVERRATQREPAKIPTALQPHSGQAVQGPSESEWRRGLTGESAVWPVRYSDVDLNGHVNSARSIGWLMDSYPAKWHEHQVARMLEVNYVGESRQGDMLSLNTLQTGPQEFLHAIRKTDRQETCRARIAWQERS